MSEDKNLNGVQDDLEEVVNGSLNEVELDEMTEALIETGEAKGSGASEAAEANTSEVKESDVAPAESEELTEEVIDEVVEEVVPLSTVELVFEDDSAVTIVVDEDFQLLLRAVCQEQGARPTSFEAVGDLSSQELRLLSKALK